MAKSLLQDWGAVESAHWLLATRYFVPSYYYPVDLDGNPVVTPGGPTFECLHSLHREIVRSFVTAWAIVNPYRVNAPYVFRAEVDPATLEILGLGENLGEEHRHENLSGPEGSQLYSCACHDDSELRTFREVWNGLGSLWEFPDHLAGQGPNALRSFGREYGDSRRHEDTRLGRAIRTFESALWEDNAESAFRSFWVLLDGLYLTGKRDDKKGCLARRIGKQLAEFEFAYDIGCLYGLRNRLTHPGDARIRPGELRPDHLRAVYDLCRLSLRRFLSNPALLAILTSRKGGDERYLTGLDS
jgi:hypothetical protein